MFSERLQLTEISMSNIGCLAQRAVDDEPLMQRLGAVLKRDSQREQDDSTPSTGDKDYGNTPR
jgi:hypothetical protein